MIIHSGMAKRQSAWNFLRRILGSPTGNYLGSISQGITLEGGSATTTATDQEVTQETTVEAPVELTDTSIEAA